MVFSANPVDACLPPGRRTTPLKNGGVGERKAVRFRQTRLGEQEEEVKERQYRVMPTLNTGEKGGEVVSYHRLTPGSLCKPSSAHSFREDS
jgi:hypothetical protein